MRYVDLTTGDLLDKPRHEVTEGRDCPSDEAVLNSLLQKKRREKTATETGIDEKTADTVGDNRQEPDADAPIGSGASHVLADERSTAAAIDSDSRSFWMTPWGVSLLWLMGLAAVFFIVVLVRLAGAARKRAETRQGRQQWVVFDDRTGEPTVARNSLPLGYQNPWI